MVKLGGWLGGFILFFVFQIVFLLYGIFYNQALVVYAAAFLLGMYGLMIAIFMGISNHAAKMARSGKISVRDN